jgi:hypothetical protein
LIDIKFEVTDEHPQGLVSEIGLILCFYIVFIVFT